MKCSACGAIGSSVQKICEFCGNAMVAEPAAQVASSATNGIAPGATTPRPQGGVDNFSAYVRDALNLIKELANSPSGGFNPAAFFFAVPYLWGFGAQDNAKSVATVLLVPQLVICLVFWLVGDEVAGLMLIAQIVWNIYVSWMVSTRSRLLVRTDSPYDWGQGILAFLVMTVLSSILSPYEF